jgi:hypothetical protein
MKTYLTETKKALRTELLSAISESGLSNNRFATERLGFSTPSRLSHIINSWEKEGLVGEETWQIIENYLMRTRVYKGVTTSNVRAIYNACYRAYTNKRVEVIAGDGGFGKTFALLKYKERQEAESRGRTTVYFFDASQVKTRKQFIVGLMQTTGCYREGVIAGQVQILRDHIARQDCLLVIDEVSSLKGDAVTIIKDVITAVKDFCGLVLSGTQYFLHNVSRGAARERHLYSELKDRLSLPVILDPPTDEEAEAIFKANGLSGEALDIAMGRRREMTRFSWKNKPTFRGIADCIDRIKSMYQPEVEVKLLEVI